MYTLEVVSYSGLYFLKGEESVGVSPQEAWLHDTSELEEIPVRSTVLEVLMKKGRMTSLIMWFKYKIFLFEKEGGGGNY